jgi:hypothetical protein
MFGLRIQGKLGIGVVSIDVKIMFLARLKGGSCIVIPRRPIMQSKKHYLNVYTRIALTAVLSQGVKRVVSCRMLDPAGRGRGTALSGFCCYK